MMPEIDFDLLDVAVVETFVADNAMALPEFAASSSQDCLLAPAREADPIS